jgi:hypothetical protein
MKNINDNKLNYKIKTNLIEKTLTMEVMNNTFYIRLENIQSSNKKYILDSINNVFKNGFIDKDGYIEILNRVTYELCISMLNNNLYHELYFTLCRKNILDSNVFNVLFNQK